MRIIGGRASGQLIKFPRGKNIRPITDRAKEAIFNILGEKVKKSTVLDLYAGSGSLGIEALSRGAKKVIFVDKNIKAAKTIRENLRKTNFSSQANVKKEKVENFLRKNKGKFDLIFVDPPWSEINLAIFEFLPSFLKKDGLIIFRYPQKEELKNLMNFIIIDQRKYGDSKVIFLKKK